MTQPPFGPPPGGGTGDPVGQPPPPPIPPGPGVSGPTGYVAPGAPGTATPGGPQDTVLPHYSPGAGQPPGQVRWQQLPPEQLARLHQPGVVPLRPLTLGDMFGGALQTMRRNPQATIGMGFLVMAVLLIPSLLLTLGLTRALRQLSEVDATLLTTLINTVFSSLSSIALTGMIVHVIGEAVLGDRAGLGSTWRAVRGRLPALVGTVLLIGVLFTILLIAIVLAVVLLAVVVEESSNGAVAVIGILLLMLGTFVFMLWAGCRISLAPSSVVLEQAGPWRAVVRAWRLTTGAQAWRVVGITVLAGIVTAIFSSVVQLPALALAMNALEGAGLSTSPIAPGVLVIDHLLQLVIGALTIPFTAGVTALLYLDQRMRREGLDVALVRAAQDRAAARAR